ncbi:tyrosine-protein phosphatase [Myroides sp. DW712]|uniref:tyrosine-protein phosphatase n=1 Tax=Myroides sp. DW712 TaxID=3389800 RepID=UPI00397C611F
MKKTVGLFMMTALMSVTSFAQTQETPIQIQLEGAINFRDIGGYSTKDGKKVKTNKIFRAAEISTLTDNDLRELEEKNITTVIDFRGTKEASLAPDKLWTDAHYILCPAGSETVNNGDAAEMIKNLKREGNQFLLDFYGEKGVAYFGDRYRTLFQKLAAKEDTGILYHCTGGRDRTGMATALILYVLNVPMETIERDFVASNAFLKEKKKVGESNTADMYKDLVKATGLTAAELEAKMALTPELIQTFFAVIEKNYGSVEQFLEKEMNLTEKDLRNIRKKYTN